MRKEKRDQSKKEQSKTNMKKKSFPRARKTLGKLEKSSFYQKAEILGLIRTFIVLAFVIQLLVEFGPHAVAQ